MNAFKSRLETEQVQFSFPWDKYTFRGFIIAVALTIASLIFFSIANIKIAPPKEYSNPKTAPIVLLNFGEGDGTGQSKGNLTKEGAAQKGAASANPLQDAQLSGATTQGQSNLSDPTQTSNLKPISAIPGDKNKNTNSNDWASSTVGAANGTQNGTGLGVNGDGRGKGYGLGEIEWGGGGNRTLMYKELPVSPKGARLGAKITMEFTVLSDGSVDKIMPVLKGDPELEEAARKAIKKWRFNKIAQNIEMRGRITVVFKNN